MLDSAPGCFRLSLKKLPSPHCRRWKNIARLCAVHRTLISLSDASCNIPVSRKDSGLCLELGSLPRPHKESSRPRGKIWKPSSQVPAAHLRHAAQMFTMVLPTDTTFSSVKVTCHTQNSESFGQKSPTIV